MGQAQVFENLGRAWASLCSVDTAIVVGPVQTGTERNGTERNRSKKWNAEGLRSDGTTSNRTVPFQKLDLFNK